MRLMTLQQLRDDDSALWHRPQVRALLAGFSVQRLAADQTEIDRVLIRAERSPMAQRALAWAQAHDIGVILDRQVQGAGAYYLHGAGVLGLSVPTLGSANFYDVVALVHEIRHAWQDHHGLLPSWTQDRFMAQGNVVTSIVQNALLEADAHAHDRAVMQECVTGTPASTTDLRAAFVGWHQAKGAFYTRLERDKHGAVLDVGGCLYPDFKIEVLPQETAGRILGVQAERAEDIVRLGKSFDGRNYLAGWYGDAVARHLHAPDRVMRAFNATAARDAVIEGVLKKQIGNRMQASPRRMARAGV